jgi:hypothetical protein
MASRAAKSAVSEAASIFAANTAEGVAKTTASKINFLRCRAILSRPILLLALLPIFFPIYLLQPLLRHYIGALLGLYTRAEEFDLASWII